MFGRGKKNKKFCPSCGRANKKDVRFCVFCGCPFPEQAQRQPAPAPGYAPSGPGPGRSFMPNQPRNNFPQPAPVNNYGDSYHTDVPKAVFMPSADANQSFISGYEDEFGGETTILDMYGGFEGDSETTLLNEVAMPAAYLIREDSGEKIPIRKQTFTIGRKQGGVDYYVTGRTSVSRIHAAIVSENGHSFIVDLNSSNKTYVKEVEIAPNVAREIIPGTRFRLADVPFVFHVE